MQKTLAKLHMICYNVYNNAIWSECSNVGTQFFATIICAKILPNRTKNVNLFSQQRKHGSCLHYFERFCSKHLFCGKENSKMRMNKDEVRQSLIEGTIRVIATDGIDGATTKQISKVTGINEAYIYRCFRDKDDMFTCVFNRLDQELANALMEAMPVMHEKSIQIEDRCFMLFSKVWRFVTGNSERCLCFMRYYYSSYFFKYSLAEHKRAYERIVEGITPAFKPGADVWMMLNHMLDIILARAVKIFSGECVNNDATATELFALIYDSVESQLSWTEKKIRRIG